MSLAWIFPRRPASIRYSVFGTNCWWYLPRFLPIAIKFLFDDLFFQRNCVQEVYRLIYRYLFLLQLIYLCDAHNNCNFWIFLYNSNCYCTTGIIEKTSYFLKCLRRECITATVRIPFLGQNVLWQDPRRYVLGICHIFISFQYRRFF